jgi:SH3-like domain-containing protein
VLAGCLAGALLLGGAGAAQEGATSGPDLGPDTSVARQPVPQDSLPQAAVPREALRSQSGLPIPRFVSLGAGEVFLRTGPGFDHPVDWVLLRRSMPVEITAEFDVWRRIRDWEGTEGWVHQRMLSGQRSVMALEPRVTLRMEPRPDAPPLAELERSVVGTLERCAGDWCRVAVEGYRGWAERAALWGTYPEEELR